MTSEQIGSLIEKQRAFYKTGATIPVKFRIAQLKKLYDVIQKYQEEIQSALTEDLGKSRYEGFMCESGLVLTEISYMLRHTRKFAKRKRVRTPLAQFPSHSYQQPVPYGNVLIMSPWNYPFLLSIDPLVNALAAGNTAIIKPSAYSPATSRMVEKIITEMEDNLKKMNTMVEIEAEATAIATSLADFMEYIDNTMDGKDYIQTMEVYGSLTDAGEHSMGVASLILGLLTLLSAAWGYLIYSRGSIAGDPVADNVMFRIAVGFFMGLVMLEVLSQVMGFNL